MTSVYVWVCHVTGLLSTGFHPKAHCTVLVKGKYSSEHNKMLSPTTKLALCLNVSDHLLNSLVLVKLFYYSIALWFTTSNLSTQSTSSCSWRRSTTILFKCKKIRNKKKLSIVYSHATDKWNLFLYLSLKSNQTPITSISLRTEIQFPCHHLKEYSIGSTTIANPQLLTSE